MPLHALWSIGLLLTATTVILFVGYHLIIDMVEDRNAPPRFHNPAPGEDTDAG